MGQSLGIIGEILNRIIGRKISDSLTDDHVTLGHRCGVSENPLPQQHTKVIHVELFSDV